MLASLAVKLRPGTDFGLLIYYIERLWKHAARLAEILAGAAGSIAEIRGTTKAVLTAQFMP